MFGWWRARTRRWAMRRRPLAFAVVAVVTATLVAGALVLGGPSVARAQGDDGELRPRLEAACARIPSAGERVQQAITRLDAPATERGSLAWFEAAVARATANGRPRIAADLQRRLDRLTDRRALLDVRVSQLERLEERCAELGVEVDAGA